VGSGDPGRLVRPYRGYADALTTSLPNAVRVLDVFHITRLGFKAVDDVRRRGQ
jgi:transposase